MIQTAQLRKRVVKTLRFQGFDATHRSFSLHDKEREGLRRVHKTARAERIVKSLKFIQAKTPTIREHLLDSRSFDPTKIDPEIIEIKSGTREADIYRWWNLTWWSLPNEKSYGRQMRFLVWDRSHNAPMGLIGLQSPILCWKPRDDHLNLTPENRVLWVNQSMNAQRIGALPPYDRFLGGKLISLLLTSSVIRKAFAEKYRGRQTLLRKSKIPARLLFVTTTGAYGKSCIYNRLKYNQDALCRFLGYTKGVGSFHILDSIYEQLVLYLRQNGHKAGRGFGNGPSAKMKIIDTSMNLMGLGKGVRHGIERGVYFFPYVSNLSEVIHSRKKPSWCDREPLDLLDFWKERWLVKRTRADYPKEKLHFSGEKHLRKLEEDLKNCQAIIRELEYV